MNIIAAAAVCLGILGMPSATQGSLPQPDQVGAYIAKSSVHVESGIEGVSSDAEARLRRQLTSDDHIVIVMLPSSDVPPETSELTEFVKRVDEATKHRYIIGLSAGSKAVGYSSLLAEGVAADLMARASNVSTNVVEAQLTFITNVHYWLAQHPDVMLPPLEQKPDDPPAPSDSGFSWWWIIIGGLALAIGLPMAVRLFFTRVNAESKRRFDGPSEVVSLLSRIMEQRVLVRNGTLRDTIQTACEDTEAYFERNTSPKFLKADTEQFCGHLTNVLQVLERYVDIQNFPRYYRTPEESMTSGCAAIEGYAQFVLDSIRRGTDVRLMEFTVQTDILSAQRNI